MSAIVKPTVAIKVAYFAVGLISLATALPPLAHSQSPNATASSPSCLPASATPAQQLQQAEANPNYVSCLQALATQAQASCGPNPGPSNIQAAVTWRGCVQDVMLWQNLVVGTQQYFAAKQRFDQLGDTIDCNAMITAKQMMQTSVDMLNGIRPTFPAPGQPPPPFPTCD